MSGMDDLFSMVPEEVKEEPKKKTEKPKKTATATKTGGDRKKYKYPFIMHIAARNVDVSHIFSEGQEYTADEITKAMLEHQFYDFAGEVTYDYIEEDNVLLPIFRQHKKG